MNGSRWAAVGVLLTALLGGAAVADEGPGAAGEDALRAIARSRVILVVEVDHRESKSFSGMTGSTFWFRVKQILRFEAEAGTQADSRWQHEFQAVTARGRDLTRYDLLEYSLLYSQDDAEAARADAAWIERLQEGRTFVLAAPTTAWFGSTGTVVAGKWASLHAYTGEPLLVPADADTLAALTDRLDEPDRAPPYTPPSPPSLPKPTVDHGRG